jgi:hypothetical protein
MSTETPGTEPSGTPSQDDTAAADAAAFAQGFAEVRGEEPPTEPADDGHNAERRTSGDNAEPETPPPAQPQPTTDPLMEKLTRLEQLLGATESRIRNVEGRFGSLNSEVLSLKRSGQQAAPAQQATAAQPKAEGESTPSGEALEELRREYPEWAKAIDQSISAAVAKATAALRPGESLSDERVQQIESTVQRNTGMRFLDTHYRGWRDEVKTDQFVQWHAAQPPEVRQLADSDDPFDAIALLDAWRAAAAAQPKPSGRTRPKDTLEAAVAVGRRPAQPATTQISDEEAFALGFNEARGGAS